MKERETDRWRALRYVLDEMNGVERREWDQRLARDQRVREMVAETVELLDCIVVVEHKELATAGQLATTVDRTARGSQAKWTAVLGAGLAAALLLCPLLLPRPGREAGHAKPSRTLSTAEQQMAVYWGENRELLDDPLWPPEQLDSAPDDSSAAEADRDREVMDVEPVSWIQQAVLELRQQSGSGELGREGGL